MNKSRRHHYVPEFITKHFSNDNGQIYVYDKILDKIYESNSKNLFVEKDRNTFINLQGNEGDEIEKIYSSMDSIFGGVLSEITKSNNITSSNFKILLLLAYISKWRVPQYDESFQNAKKIFSIDGFLLFNFPRTIIESINSLGFSLKCIVNSSNFIFHRLVLSEYNSISVTSSGIETFEISTGSNPDTFEIILVSNSLFASSFV